MGELADGPTFSSLPVEFWFTSAIAGVPAEFGVIELRVPRGMRLVLRDLNASISTRIVIGGATMIVGADTPVLGLLANPAGFFSGVGFSGTRADIGLFGFVHTQGSRDTYSLRAVVDSVPNQIISFIGQIANTAYEVSVHGLYVPASFDTGGRTVT